MLDVKVELIINTFLAKCPDVVRRTELKALGFPLSSGMLASLARIDEGPTSYRFGKSIYYQREDLVAFLRSRTFANTPEGNAAHRSGFRPAEVLEVLRNADGHPRMIKLSCAWLPPVPKNRLNGREGGRTRRYGQLAFRCPVCGRVHYHGATGPKFGDGDGHRVPHCAKRDFEGQFVLVEVADVTRAGDLSADLHRRVRDRSQAEPSKEV